MTLRLGFPQWSSLVGRTNGGFCQGGHDLSCLITLCMLENWVVSLFLFEGRFHAEEMREFLSCLKQSIRTTENCTLACHWAVADHWLDVYMCSNKIAFCAYSSHPESYSVELLFYPKIKLIAKWFLHNNIDCKGMCFYISVLLYVFSATLFQGGGWKIKCWIFAVKWILWGMI